MAYNNNTLSQKQIAEFYEAFYIIDKDSDGYITMEELASTIQSLGAKRPTKEEVQDMMSEVEGGENGIIGFPEFLNIMARKTEENASDELREAFRVFDRNQDGYISATELRHVMSKMKKKLTLEESEQMIREADLDGDGQLNFEEFAKMMSLY